MSLVHETESTTVLTSAAFLVSTFSMNLVNTVIGTVVERDGDLLTTDVVEEMALSDLQKRIVSKVEV
uniref:Uncharacterized protein n=1 Tax=Myoviridae sp. ctLnO19 TaxID=2825085 RepID=A0A8S5P187_9CAUD|nr:MAG TPA: hypothetical protein [Myoviridae sp. ctLnO19]